MARTTIDSTAPDADESGTVATTTRFNVEQLRSINSFEDAVALAAEMYGADSMANASTELGDGFVLISGKHSKDQFVRIDGGLFFLSWTFSPGDYGREMVTARVITKNGGKYVINDGSTGIAAQLREYTDRTGRDGGLYAARGLRKSTYENEYTEDGTTYYIDTAG